ncbi:hypothetical protein LIER_09837 [Lithospermum erythrorhizon]|uniref:Late embryogenesis abundant protein LEA-2 subgroup domain-containing protein n=1 Tax=Lithospermum erythrorhizon TaxID=34254 RepID=A0AAV3PHB1_LITER
MGEDKEQTRPLASTSHHITINNNNEEQQRNIPMQPPQTTKKQRRRRRCIQCCGCATATILILVIIIVTLALTVFKVKDPKMKLNSITIDGWSQVIWTNLQPGMNLTIIADVSVKNDNYASFKYRNASTNLFYDGGEVGEALNPPGNARARKTVRLNIEIVLMLDRIIGVQRLGSDLIAMKLPVSSHTEITGKVSVMKIVKRTVDVKIDCNFVLNMQTQQIDDLSCKNKFSL